MRKTVSTTRPGVRAYLALGVLSAVDIAMITFKLTQVAIGLNFGRGVNTLTLATAVILTVAAGALACWVLDRRRGAEIAQLRQEVIEIEDSVWWSDPATDPDGDTVDLSRVGSNVVALRPRRRPLSKSS